MRGVLNYQSEKDHAIGNMVAMITIQTMRFTVPFGNMVAMITVQTMRFD